MPCYHPLKAFPYGKTVNGKDNYIITSYDVNHQEVLNDNIKEVYDFGRMYVESEVIRDYKEIPCGKCIGCRLDYSRTWANRMMLELQFHDSAYFLTITYDNDNVPVSYYADENTGEAIPALTLKKRDVQLFFKRLRKSGQKVRYYLAGEYGETTMRPHYHAIVYGLELNDLEIIKKSSAGILYKSDQLTKIWQNGMIGVAPVSWNTCAYVARYVTKKLNGGLTEFYKIHNIEPEFCVMSRRPGIGRLYYEDNKERIYDTDELIISTKEGGIIARPPKYFDSLYEIEYPEKFEEIKERRIEKAKALRKLKLAQTDLNYMDLLRVEESKKLRKIKSLDRSEI